MSIEWEDDYDDEPEVEELGPCPECCAEIDVEAEMCPICGHWLSTTERHKLWDGGSRSRAVLSAGQKKVLVIVLAVLFLGSMFRMIW